MKAEDEPQDPTEEVRKYLIECLKFQQRPGRPKEVREAAYQFEEIIKLAKVDTEQRHLQLANGTEGGRT